MLRQEIIRIHDQAMEKIGTLYQLESFLLKHRRTVPDEATATDVIASLQGAQRVMFTWMRQYQLLAVGENLGDDNHYRLRELQKIRAIAQQTDEAIKRAEMLKEVIAAASPDPS